MSALSRFFVRHTLSLAVAALAILAAPHVASGISWKLSALFDHAGGMHIYALGGGGSQTSVDDSQMIIDPLSPLLLLTLAVVAVVSVAGDVARRKLPWLTWCLPIVPAVPLGVLVGFLAAGEGSPGDLPAYVPYVVGITFTLVIAMLFAAYWATLIITGRIMTRRAD